MGAGDVESRDRVRQSPNREPRDNTPEDRTGRTISEERPLTDHSDERIALFIAGANLHSASRALGFNVDFKRLLEHFGEQGRLVRALYYPVLFDEVDYSPLRPLVDWLEYNGYTLVTKRAKEFTDADGHRQIKGNMEVEIAIDAMEMAPNLDRIVLFCGDRDFRRLVEAVQREGAYVSVVSTLLSHPPMLADELRRQADEFIELADLAPEIARPPQSPAVRAPTPAPPEVGGAGYE